MSDIGGWGDDAVGRAANRLEKELGWKIGYCNYRHIAKAVLEDAADKQPRGAVDRVTELEAELKLAHEIIRMNGWPDFAAPATANVPPANGGQ